MNEKIPTDIVQILAQCGYDSEISISLINSDTIKEIEETVNEDLSVLNNTSYEGVPNFKLKPGHKSYIINLPNQIHRMKKTTYMEPKNVKCQIFLTSYERLLKLRKEILVNIQTGSVIMKLVVIFPHTFISCVARLAMKH